MLRELTKIATTTIFLAFWGQASGQGLFKFPSLNEVRLGHVKEFKVPTLKDFQKFSGKYQKHLALLDRRSEKAYRKSFLKFIALEDKLLYTLCDSNEFQANMLMRSAGASFGKMESDRLENPKKKFNFKAKTLKTVADVSHNLIPGMDGTGKDKAQDKHTKKKNRFGAQEYAGYMQKRVRLYKNVFPEGTKKQRKLFRKLRRRAALWQSFKAEDKKLISKFADKNMGIMRSVKATGPYKDAMKSTMPNYKGTHIDPKGTGTALDKGALLTKFKDRLTSDGNLSADQIEGVESLTDLFKKVQEAKEALPDSLKPKSKKTKPVKIDPNQAKTFWDRLYGGMDFNWENSTGYYPDGLGLTFTGGYKISENAGLNLDLETLFNAAEMGWSRDDGFDPTLISNYSIGANLDHRIWKIFFAGVGAEMIINTIDAPAQRLLHEIENPEYTLGVPLILKAIVPLAGGKSTNIEFRYDLNSQNNVKPKFDLKVGFLIGR